MVATVKDTGEKHDNFGVYQIEILDDFSGDLLHENEIIGFSKALRLADMRLGIAHTEQNLTTDTSHYDDNPLYGAF